MTLLHEKQRRQPLSSADAIAGNEDLMTEILIRLPAKSLCRFKSVSKIWNSLISHPHFTLLRMPKSVSGFHLRIPIYSRADFPSYTYVHLAGNRTMGDPFTSLTFVDDPMGIKILHSSNGFLLCSSSAYSLNRNYYIYNPTTKQFAIIPPPNDDAVIHDANFAMNLAFDPCKAPHYKIVLVRSRRVSSGGSMWSCNNQIEIYSSETGSWRLSGDPFTSKTSSAFKNGVFCNGIIHWLSKRMETWLRFDVDEECLGTVPMPPIQDGRKRRKIGYFGESQGHLHFICICPHSYSSPFEVFELESDYSKWYVKYHVHLDALTATFPECLRINFFSILHLVRGEVEDESYLVLQTPGMVISYNFKDKTLKKLCNLLRSRTWFQVHQHIETFVRI